MNKNILKPSQILLTTFFALSINACSQPNTDISLATVKVNSVAKPQASTPQENPLFSISQDAEKNTQNTASYATQLTHLIGVVA